MPSLRGVAHDGVLCTFCNKSAPDRGKWCGPSRQAGMDRPSRTKSHPAVSLSSSQPGGPPCWASPLAFGLIGQNFLPGFISHTVKNCRIFPCMKIHIMVCVVIIILLNWWWIYAIRCHGPLLFFPRIFPEVYSGIFLSSRLPSSPPPLFFNEFVFVDSGSGSGSGFGM